MPMPLRLVSPNSLNISQARLPLPLPPATPSPSEPVNRWLANSMPSFSFCEALLKKARQTGHQ